MGIRDIFGTAWTAALVLATPAVVVGCGPANPNDPGNIPLDTYDFSDDDAPAATASFTDNGDIGETFGADSGTLEKAIDDESAQGTFDFEGTLADGTRTVSVTHGVFDVEWGLFPGFQGPGSLVSRS